MLKYKILLKGSDDKRYVQSYASLRQELGICHMKIENAKLRRKIECLTSILNHEIVEYFKDSIIRFLNGRTKKFRASFVIDNLEFYGLYGQYKHLAFRKLIEDKVIDDAGRGWFSKSHVRRIK